MAGLSIPISITDMFSKALEKLEVGAKSVATTLENMGDALSGSTGGLNSFALGTQQVATATSKAGGAMDDASASSISFGDKLQIVYHAMGIIRNVAGPVKEAIDELGLSMRASALMGEAAGEGLFWFADEAAKRMGRSASELKKAGVEWARIGAGGESIIRLTEVADKFSKFTPKNDFNEVADKLKDAIQNKNISGMADILGGGAGVERMLKRGGMERALKRGDIQGALDVYEKVADRLGYTKEKADILNDTIGNKFQRISSRIKDSVMRLFTTLSEKLKPILNKVIEIMESPEVQTALEEAHVIIERVASAVQIVILTLFDAASAAKRFVDENKSLLESVAIAGGMTAAVYGVGVAFNAAKFAAIAFGRAVSLQGGVVALFSRTATVMLSHPFAVMAAAVGISVIALQKGLEYSTGESLSFCDVLIGMFVGGFTTIGEFIYNVALGMLESIVGNFIQPSWDAVISFVEFLANVFTDPVGAINNLFSNLAVTIMDIFRNIMSAINRVIGSETIDKAIAGLDGLMDRAKKWGEKNRSEDYISFEDKRFRTKDVMDKAGFSRVDYGSWSGKAIGASINFKNNLFGNKQEVSIAPPKTADEMLEELKKLENNTGKIADTVSRQQDLQWMKELAERNFTNYVNVRTLTPTVNVKMTNSTSNARNVAKEVANVLTNLQSAGANAAYMEV